MRSFGSSFLIAVMLSLLQALTTAAGQSADRSRPQWVGGGFRIAGVVVNAKTGSPLPRARVSISDTRNPQRSASTLTSEDGKFTFNTVPAGKFALEGAKRGFIRAAYDQHDQFSTAIAAGAGLDTENLVLRLDPAAVLSGKVLDESGDPVRHASVSIYREDHYSGVSRIRRYREGGTDDQGSFEITPLDAGTYFIAVRAKPWYEVHPMKSRVDGAENLPTQVDASLDVAYPTTYYGDTTDSEDATPIPVRGGDHVDVEIHLNPVPALHLLMQAPADRANGISMPILRKNAFDGLERVEMGGIQMISPGLYEVTGLPAGRYAAQFAVNGQFGASSQVDLTSDGQEISAASGEAGSTVKATVQIPGQTKLPAQLVVVLRDVKGKTVTGQEVDEQGQVNFGAIAPGRYNIAAYSSDTAYSVVRISAQGAEISGHTLNVIAGFPMTALLTVIPGVVNVEGFAKRGGKAAPGVMVALVPMDPENNRELFRRDQSDLDGSFNLRSVIPGKYTVVAIENGWDLDWAQPSVIAHYAEHGQSLRIDERSQGTVHLPEEVEVQPR
jgi:protocatechuate 3,4-dioxygenase beta subunit